MQTFINLLKRLFSIEHAEDFYTKINFLGLKISKYNTKAACKNLYKNLYKSGTFEFVNSIWMENGARQDLLSYFEFISMSSHAWRFYDNQFWLVYLSCLVEINNTEEAQSLLKKYIIHHGLSDIERYLLVAKFALHSGFSNAEVKKAATVYDKLSEGRENKAFEKLIEGKAVAIVGNGSSEIGKSKGAEIDAHDVVIRINNYQIDGFETDYGSKTDIWVKCSSDDICHNIREEKIKLVIYEPDFIHHAVADGYLDAMVNSVKDIDYFNFEDHSHLRKKLNIFPSTGLITIEKVLNSSAKSLQCYGFQFLQDKPDDYSTHYFNDRDMKEAKQRSAHHSYAIEACYLAKLFKE